MLDVLVCSIATENCRTFLGFRVTQLVWLLSVVSEPWHLINPCELKCNADEGYNEFAQTNLEVFCPLLSWVEWVDKDENLNDLRQIYNRQSRVNENLQPRNSPD